MYQILMHLQRVYKPHPLQKLRDVARTAAHLSECVFRRKLMLLQQSMQTDDNCYMSTYIVSPGHDEHTDNPLVAVDDKVPAHLLQREMSLV